MSRTTGLDVQELRFNPKLAERRLAKAERLLGKKILLNLLCFCLYLLGLKRKIIAKVLRLPEGTVRSKLKLISRDGLPALRDRRNKETPGQNSPKPSTDIEKTGVEGSEENRAMIEQCGEDTIITIKDCDIVVSSGNELQLKTIVLTLAQNSVIPKIEAARILNLSPSQVGNLCENMSENDVHGLMDGRQGQQKNYRFTEEVISEMIVQFAFNAAVGKSGSSNALSQDIKDRTELNLSPRSIRMHFSKLGLSGAWQQLKELLESQKKSLEKLSQPQP